MRQLFIEDIPGSLRAGVTEDGVLSEFYISSGFSGDLSCSGEGPRRGSVYAGKITRVIPGLAAFLDIGDIRAAYLEPGKNGFPPQVMPGNVIPALAERERLGSKGARLSSDPVITGRYLVLRPGSRENRISPRITGEHRNLITETAYRVVDNHVHKSLGHFTVRTMTQEIPEGLLEKTLRKEADRLYGVWLNVRESFRNDKKIRCLYEAPGPIECLVRDSSFDAIIVSGARAFSAMSDIIDRYFTEELRPELRLFGEDNRELLFDHYGFEKEIRQSFQHQYRLPSGGELVFDEAEALTAVDVNSGSQVTGSSDEEKAFLVNREAALALPVQIRLRGLGGIIAVDFLNMRSPSRRMEILRLIRDGLKSDPLVSRVTEFSELGLLEISRMRVRKSQLAEHSQECPQCRGRGSVPNTDMILGDIARELFRRRAAHPGYQQVLLGDAEHMKLFRGSGQEFISMVAADLGITVAVREMTMESREPWGIITGEKMV